MQSLSLAIISTQDDSSIFPFALVSSYLRETTLLLKPKKDGSVKANNNALCSFSIPVGLLGGAFILSINSCFLTLRC